MNKEKKNILNIEKWGELVISQKSYSSKDNLEKEFEKITSYFFLFDCFTNQVIFTNSAFETITGYKAADFTIDLLLEMIHPEDRDYFFACEERGLNFTNSLSFNEHFKYTMNYTYRILTKSGNCIMIQQECQAIEVNTSGHLTKTLVNHRWIPMVASRSERDYKIYDKTKNIFIDSDNCYNLSDREFEVLSLIQEGRNSGEIAELLHISKNTVITHRKNILNKTDSNSFMELIKKLSFSHIAD